MSPSLSARSIIASTLLGTHPPRLEGRLLVAFAREFGVSDGTTRVALSRMVERDELVNDDGTYGLSGRLLDRQLRQSAGLAPPIRPWDGDWELYVIRAGARPSSERTAVRDAFGHLGCAERRDGVWLRPDNLDAGRLRHARRIVDEQADRFVAHPDDDPQALAAELFPLRRWASEAQDLLEQMEVTSACLSALRTGADEGSLATGFELAARVLRHLVADPVLPPDLAPPDWPAPALRGAYANYDETYRASLADFFRAHRG